jgi:hypothetical protein
MDGTLSQLLVEIDFGAGADPEGRYRLAHRLRAELLDLDVASVHFAADGVAPGNAKGSASGGFLEAGGLVVRLAGPAVLQSVVSSVWSWLTRQRCRSVKLVLDGDTLELCGVSSAEQKRLIDLWVARHADSG